uniref:NAD(P)/FAD-dependent oxidoreductase n=1 Tax=Bradyrhizobium sp. Ai1a-2 TaxID=196490 RepID=UPI001AEBBED2
CAAFLLTAAFDGTMVTGVICEDADGEDETLAADLVVDATGRATPTLALLGSTGQKPPEEIVIGIDLHYTTTMFAIPKDRSNEWDTPADWIGVGTWPPAPDRSHAGYFMPTEGKRWMATFSGQNGLRPPADPEGFLCYARQLNTPTIYNAIKNAERTGGFERYFLPASIWRRFDRLGTFPRGLLPIGDSICRFNPVYGQGMSVAAQEARLLNQILKGRAAKPDPLAGLAAAFFSKSLPLIEGPWNMSAVPDLAYPGTRGDRPPDFESHLQYNKALFKAAILHADVHRRLAEVQQLLEPPDILKTPYIEQLVQVQMDQLAPDPRRLA